MSHVSHSRRGQTKPVDNRPHLRVGPIERRRMLLIGKPVQIPGQLFAAIQKLFRTGGTIGCAMISRSGGLSQNATQCAPI
jgi:hypothetical protein